MLGGTSPGHENLDDLIGQVISDFATAFGFDLPSRQFGDLANSPSFELPTISPIGLGEDERNGK